MKTKMLLMMIIKNNKIYDISGQVRLRKGQLCPAGLGKILGTGPTGLEQETDRRTKYF